jgi:hypothetical protein
MECLYCGRRCRRAGRQKKGAQRFYCATCEKYQQSSYRYKACSASTSRQIKALVRGIARILGIARQTVLKRTVLIAKTISRPVDKLDQPSFEVDELWTYLNRKDNEYWVAYAIDRRTRSVVDFVVGETNEIHFKGVGR